MPDLSPEQQHANQLIAQANQCYAAENYLEAIQLYREGIAAYPTPSYRTFNLVIGEMLAKLKKWDEAIAAYQQVIEASPDHDQAWQSLAECYMIKGDHPQALDAAVKAIEINPDDYRSHYNSAMLYALRGDHDLAKDHLQCALQLAPSWRNYALDDGLLSNYLDPA